MGVKIKLIKIFSLAAAILGGAVLLSSVAPSIKAVGQPPTECEATTTANPRGARCNPSCTTTNCIEYCPAYQGGATIIVPEDIKELTVKYRLIVRPIWLTVEGTSIQNVKLDCGSSGCIGEIKDTSGATFKKGQKLKIIIKDGEGYSIGFRSPNSSWVCGEDNICRETGGSYGTFSIQSLIPDKNDSQVKLISAQCYGDSPIGDADFDFNDYALVLVGTPEQAQPQAPACVEIAPRNARIGVGGSLEFSCTIQDATKCIIDGKEVAANNNVCKYTKTFNTAGSYQVVCKAQGQTNTTESCIANIDVVPTVTPTDTSGGPGGPILITILLMGAVGYTSYLAYSRYVKIAKKD